MDIELLDDFILPAMEQEESSSPVYLSEVQEFLSGFDATPNVRRLLEYLLRQEFTLGELQQGLRHPLFLQHCAGILGPGFFSLPLEDKTASIRRVLAKIEALSDSEITESTTPVPPSAKAKKGQKAEKEREKSNVNTLRRLSVLAALYQETAGLPIIEIEQRSCLQLRRLRDALRDLEETAFIEKEKSGKNFLYKLTHSGIAHLVSSTVTFWQYDIRYKSTKSYCQNVTVGFTGKQLSEFIRMALEIDKELLAMGWYSRSIKKAFQRHKLEYILSLIQRVKGRIKGKPGAYLYAILVKGVSEDTRKDAIVRKILRELPADLMEVYMEEAAFMSPDEARHFANALRKRHQKAQAKGETLLPGEVESTANYVRKRRGGSRMVR